MDTHPGEVGPVELTTKYDSIFSAQEAASGGWPDRLTLKAIAWAESGLDEKAIPLDASGKPISTARGLFQMSKGAWEDVMSFNHTLPSWSTGKFDPMWNCMAAAGYLHLVAVGAMVLGTALGKNVGLALGAQLGMKDGFELGVIEGVLLGVIEGILLGAKLGV